MEQYKTSIEAIEQLFNGQTGGIDNLVSGNKEVLSRIQQLPKDPISCSQMNQLLAMSHQAAMSEAFFEYYWLSCPQHTFDIEALPYYDKSYSQTNAILSADQMGWGLYRLYTDCLLYFGTIRIGYKELRQKSYSELSTFFTSKTFNAERLRKRGKTLLLEEISQDDRYLISEQACKTLDHPTTGRQELDDYLAGAWLSFATSGKLSAKVSELINPKNLEENDQDGQQRRLLFVADEILDREVSGISELVTAVNEIETTFLDSRDKALRNTELYLSMANDIDVYVATSMRKRDDFREVANFCKLVFSSAELQDLNVRFFDPTLSAAKGHEDKGLIECLMVKCAKLLVYTAGKSDSYGKDAEAAMALSLGKPVIFYCDQEYRKAFFTDIHPLSRLIAFDTGVAVGVMAVCDPRDVIKLCERLFLNKMRYNLKSTRRGHFQLIEDISPLVSGENPPTGPQVPICL